MRELNRRQVVGARRHVYMRPRSGLEAFVEEVRHERPNVDRLARELLQRYLTDNGY